VPFSLSTRPRQPRTPPSGAPPPLIKNPGGRPGACVNFPQILSDYGCHCIRVDRETIYLPRSCLQGGMLLPLPLLLLLFLLLYYSKPTKEGSYAQQSSDCSNQHLFQPRQKYKNRWDKNRSDPTSWPPPVLAAPFEAAPLLSSRAPCASLRAVRGEREREKGPHHLQRGLCACWSFHRKGDGDTSAK